MALKSKLLLTFICLLPVFSIQAKIVLPELLAKQAVANIRFISNSGKFTYYQKRSGSLLYSSNYKVIELLQGEIGTQYEIIGTTARKKLLISQNTNFHNFYSVRANEKLFLVNFGETQVKEIGFGVHPQLHENDNWLSYYNFYTRTLTFEHTTNSALRFTLKLNNKVNPYFFPDVVMTDENNVYYTDLGENGNAGIVHYQRNLNKSEIIHKNASALQKIELCVNESNFIVGFFGINFSKTGSQIARLPLTNPDFSKREIIYTSANNDLGQMICTLDKGVISFIRNTGSPDTITTDIFDLKLDNKELKPLSELKTVTSIIDMDGTLLTLEKGRYLIVKGNSDFKNVDSLKALPPDGANEAIRNLDKETVQ